MRLFIFIFFFGCATAPEPVNNEQIAQDMELIRSIDTNAEKQKPNY